MMTSRNRRLKQLKSKNDYFRYEFDPIESGDCLKIKYNKSKAKKASRELTHKFGYEMRIYKCHNCSMWHLAKKEENNNGK